MRTTVILASSVAAVVLLGVGCLTASIAVAAPPSESTAGPAAAPSGDRKPASTKSVQADPAIELLAAVKALAAQVEEQTKMIGQLQRRLDEYNRQLNGRLMVTCLAAMTAVPSPDWGLPIGKADKAGILAACTHSDGWAGTYFDASHAELDVFAPFR
jgi:hypothetical protein